MKTAIYTITSPLHDEQSVNQVSSAFLSEIENAMEIVFDFRGSDFSAYGTDALDIIFVRTGGTEGIFKELLPHLNGRILLLTSGKSNSLAASLEILSYLRQQGRSGEVIHGSISYIAARIRTLAKVEEARSTLDGCRLGSIGEPSDWLISSNVQRESVKEKLGIEIVDIPIEELIESVSSGKEFEISDQISRLRDNILAQAPDPIRQYAEGAIRIYAALKDIVMKYSLSMLRPSEASREYRMPCVGPAECRGHSGRMRRGYAGPSDNGSRKCTYGTMRLPGQSVPYRSSDRRNPAGPLYRPDEYDRQILLQHSFRVRHRNRTSRRTVCRQMHHFQAFRGPVPLILLQG